MEITKTNNLTNNITINLEEEISKLNPTWKKIIKNKQTLVFYKKCNNF